MKRLTKIIPTGTDAWQVHLKDFLTFKAAQGLAPRTLKDYSYHVKLFFSRYSDVWGDQESLRRTVLDYFAESAQFSPDTYNTRRKCLKAFFRWAVGEGILPADPTEGLKTRKSEGRVRDIPEDVLRRLLSLPDRSTYTGLRDYCLLLVTLDTGIRPSEALALSPGDINLSGLTIHIRAEVAKTHVPRILPISTETASTIRRLLSIRPPTWVGAPLFCSCDGRPLKPNGWRLRLDRYKAKLGAEISPYDLRHVFALLYLRGGGDPFTLQRTMGHADLSMTKRYLALTNTDLEVAHKKATPLNRILPKRRVRRIKKEQQ